MLQKIKFLSYLNKFIIWLSFFILIKKGLLFKVRLTLLLEWEFEGSNLSGGMSEHWLSASWSFLIFSLQVSFIDLELLLPQFHHLLLVICPMPHRKGNYYFLINLFPFIGLKLIGCYTVALQGDCSIAFGPFFQKNRMKF